MNCWSDTLKNSVNRNGAAVVVTVVGVQGSTPREVGATMIVSAGGNSGTIGGGNLEHTCIKEAVKLLSGGDARSCDDVRYCRQLPLGPALGQCCGGNVELLFEYVSAETDWYKLMTTGHGLVAGHLPVTDRWLCRSLDSAVAMLLNTDELRQRFSLMSNLDESNTSAEDKIINPGVVCRNEDASRWFCQRPVLQKPSVLVYGAGHVGQSVVAQLALLPCHITMLDHREDWLQLQADLEVTRQLTDSPEDDAIIAPVDAAHVVMTHSHALDFEICLALLKRAEFSWLGLIGSDTKRQTFTKRLRLRGIGEDKIQRLHCPIGNLQLESCLPPVIALNLAAELAFHWQQTGKLR